VLPSQFPQWVIDNMIELMQGYKDTLPLIEERCRLIAESGKDRDDIGTLTEWRGDAKYCAGMASRLAQVEEGPWRETPFDPRQLAAWAWQPIGDGYPAMEPMDAIRALTMHDLMDKFSVREAEALILCEGLGMTPKQAAQVMRCDARTVTKVLWHAREKFGPNVDEG
jgi:hypothetical protein